MQKLFSRAVSRLRTRKPRPLILLYHRVATVTRDPWALCVSPENFARQMAYLRQHRTVLTMEEFVNELRLRKLPDDAVAVTFDDAYRDNLVNALPALIQHGIPATIFVPTWWINGTQPFWWDELAGMILDATVGSDIVQTWGETQITLRWQPPERGDEDRSWRGWDPPLSGRQRVFVQVWSLLQRASVDRREELIASLRKQLPYTTDPLALPMNTEEIRQITSSGLVSLGGHTVTHASLTDISHTEAAREIWENRAQLEALCSASIPGFAYPYGNMNETVQQEVEAQGFAWACAAQGGLLDNSSLNMYALPRFAVEDGPIAEFERMLVH